MAIPTIAPYDIPPAPATSAAPWTINPARAALLVHDLQEYFLAAYDRSAAPAQPMLSNIGKLLAYADQHQLPVFFSAQPPRQKAARRGLLLDLWGPGLQTDAEAAIVEDLYKPERENHHLLTKWRYSAFERTDLRQALACAGRDQLIITGVYGHMGCKVTATDAFMNDIQPFLISDAIADFTAADHAYTLDWVARRAGVVCTTATVTDSSAGQE